MKKSKLLAVMAAVIVSRAAPLFSLDFFQGYAGAIMDFDTADKDLGLALQAFFAGQFSFTQNFIGRLELSIDTDDLIEENIFKRTLASFKLDELSLNFRKKTDALDNHFSVFLGTYEPIGSDVFLRRHFGTAPIASRVTESWLGLSGSVVCPLFGIGIADVIEFKGAPIALGIYAYVNKDGYAPNKKTEGDIDEAVIEDATVLVDENGEATVLDGKVAGGKIDGNEVDGGRITEGKITSGKITGGKTSGSVGVKDIDDVANIPTSGVVADGPVTMTGATITGIDDSTPAAIAGALIADGPRENNDLYALNFDLRFACALPHFFVDLAAGIALPFEREDQYDDALIVVKRVNMRCGLNMLVGNNSTRAALFVQAGFHKLTFTREDSDDKVDWGKENVYLLFEPRFHAGPIHLDLTAFNFPQSSADDMLVLSGDRFGVNALVYNDMLYIGRKAFTFGIHTTVSLQKNLFTFLDELSDFKVEDDLHVTISPFLSTKIAAGELNIMIKARITSFFWGGKPEEAITLHVGYRTHL